MKNQFIKSSLFLLGVTVLFTACVETDDLANMEELQKATINNKLNEAQQTDIDGKKAIATKVYDMQNEVATLKSEILGLQRDSNQIQFIIKDTRASITADSATSVANAAIIGKLAAANTAADYTSAINTLYTDVSTSNSALEASKLAYDKALDTYNIAGAKATNSALKYTNAGIEKDAAAADTATFLGGLPSRGVLTLAINKSNTLVATYLAVQLQFKATVDALLLTVNTTSAAKDAAYSEKLKAQAVVENDALNSITNTAHTDALTLANTNYGTAATAYTTAAAKYTAATAEFETATANLTAEQKNLINLSKQASDFDVSKGIFVAARDNQKALLADKLADEVTYDNLKPAKDAALTAKTVAQSTYDANNGALTLVKADKKTLVDAIAAIAASENGIQKNIKKNGDILIQLSTQSYNLVTIVKDVIASKQEKIKALEIVIAAYKVPVTTVQ